MQGFKQFESKNGAALDAKAQSDYVEQCVNEARDKCVSPYTGLQFANQIIEILNLTMRAETRNVVLNVYNRRDEIRALAKLLYNHFCGNSQDDQIIFSDEVMAGIVESTLEILHGNTPTELPPLRAIWPPETQLPDGHDGSPIPAVAINPFVPIESLIQQIRLITQKSIKTTFSYARQSTIAFEIEELCNMYTAIIKETNYDLYASIEPDLLKYLAYEARGEEMQRESQELAVASVTLTEEVIEENEQTPAEAEAELDRFRFFSQLSRSASSLMNDFKSTIGEIVNGIDKAYQCKNEKVVQPGLAQVSNQIDLQDMKSPLEHTF